MAEFINLFISPLRFDIIPQINNQFCNRKIYPLLFCRGKKHNDN